MVLSTNAADDWSKWLLYENSHFKIYSDAKEKKVVKLLKELEKFHVLVQSALSTSIPADAPKTLVLLFKRRHAFKQFVWNKKLAGFVAAVDGIPVIVMSTSQKSLNAIETVKHEYVHVAQAYGKKAFPNWLNEGMAEMLSTAKYKDNLALVGHAVKERWQYLSNEFSYDELIRDDFDGLKFRSGADAYAQYWLLTVYSLAHDEGVYRDELGKYIGLYRQSGDSVSSFKQAYGRSANDFGREAMRNMSRKHYSYMPLVWMIDHEQIDLRVTKSEAGQETLLRLAEVLRERAEKIKNEKKH